MYVISWHKYFKQWCCHLSTESFVRGTSLFNIMLNDYKDWNFLISRVTQQLLPFIRFNEKFSMFLFCTIRHFYTCNNFVLAIYCGIIAETFWRRFLLKHFYSFFYIIPSSLTFFEKTKTNKEFVMISIHYSFLNLKYRVVRAWCSVI